MTQVPAAMNVAVLPETVHLLPVVELKETARPELAVAESVNGVPTICAPGLAKVMVCGSPLTVKVCETSGAAK